MRKREKHNWSIIAVLGLSLGLAILFLIFSYVQWNRPYALGKDVDVMVRRSAWARRALFKDEVHSEIRAVNIAYDKQLVPYFDDQRLPAGTIDITDRQKLYTLFAFLEKNPSYQYIVCDINFAERVCTPYDSLLFDIIMRMPRICVACGDSVVPVLKDVSCYAGYTMRQAGSGFLQFKYTHKGNPTIPVRMWQDIDGGKYEKHWYGYTRNGCLCTDGVIPDMRFTVEDGYKNINDCMGEKLIYNLGADILDDPTLSPDFFKDKIILIGDWTENDMHDTIRLEQPGVLILYNAYLALRDGLNRLSWWLILLLLVVYWALCLYAVFPLNPTLAAKNQGFIEWEAKHRVLKFFLNLCSIALILQLVCWLCYFLFDQYVNVLVISILLSLVSSLVNKIVHTHEN